jgi:hypothetical protein
MNNNNLKMNGSLRFHDLPESVVHKIYKILFTNDVLHELKNNKRFRTHALCLNCCIHGFPCFLCAEYIYIGKMGPGYEYNVRKLEKQNSYTVECLINIIIWLLYNKNKNIVQQIDNTVFNITLPQNIVYRETFTRFFHESIDYYMNRSSNLIE